MSGTLTSACPAPAVDCRRHGRCAQSVVARPAPPAVDHRVSARFITGRLGSRTRVPVVPAGNAARTGASREARSLALIVSDKRWDHFGRPRRATAVRSARGSGWGAFDRAVCTRHRKLPQRIAARARAHRPAASFKHTRCAIPLTDCRPRFAACPPPLSEAASQNRPDKSQHAQASAGLSPTVRGVPATALQSGIAKSPRQIAARASVRRSVASFNTRCAPACRPQNRGSPGRGIPVSLTASA
jgi:hypothetical protein